MLIAGCIAAATVANFAGTAMPLRTPVAVGSALLGVLLVVRRRRAAGIASAQPDAIANEAERVEVAGVAELRGTRRRKRVVQAAALDAGLLAVRQELEAHEQRLTSLSGRQTLIDVNAREKLAELSTRIEELEVDRAHLVALYDEMRNENHANLKRLEAVFVDHQRAIAQLVETYGHRPKK